MWSPLHVLLNCSLTLNSTLRIHQLLKNEIPATIEQFAATVYDRDLSEAQAHFDESVNGPSDTFLAHVDDDLAGFVTIRWESHNEQFKREGIPFIHHLLVFDDYQGQGIANALLDAAEQLIGTRASKAGICVGIFDTYGPAQRLYAKRGYIPDGRGVCQWHRPIKLGETVTIDHDLIFWLIKSLSNESN